MTEIAIEFGTSLYKSSPFYIKKHTRDVDSRCNDCCLPDEGSRRSESLKVVHENRDPYPACLEVVYGKWNMTLGQFPI